MCEIERFVGNGQKDVSVVFITTVIYLRGSFAML